MNQTEEAITEEAVALLKARREGVEEHALSGGVRAQTKTKTHKYRGRDEGGIVNDNSAPEDAPTLEQLAEAVKDPRAEVIKKRLATRARLTAEQIAELNRDICEFDQNPRPPKPGEYAFCMGLNEPDQYWDSDYSVIGYARYIAARCIDWAEAVYNSLYDNEEPLRLEKRTQYGGLIWKSLPLPAKLRVEAHFIREHAESGDINQLGKRGPFCTPSLSLA